MLCRPVKHYSAMTYERSSRWRQDRQGCWHGNCENKVSSTRLRRAKSDRQPSIKEKRRLCPTNHKPPTRPARSEGRCPSWQRSRAFSSSHRLPLPQFAEPTADLRMLARPSAEAATLPATALEDCGQIEAPSPVVPPPVSQRTGDFAYRDDGTSDLVTRNSSGCPAGVWLDHHEDVDYGGPNAIGVTWCKYTSSHTVTVGWFFTITVTICVYSGCDLVLTEEEANAG